MSIEECREAISQLRAQATGKLRKVPDEIQEQILDCLGDDKLSIQTFAERIGYSQSALRKWQKKRLGVGPSGIVAGRFQEVKINKQTERSGGISVEAPHGVRIVGLNLKELCQVIRGLS
jgi:AraC-like DNA-binding protein